MIIYVTLCLGVIAYLLNILQTSGYHDDDGDADYIQEYTNANTSDVWKPKVTNTSDVLKDTTQVEGLLAADFSKASLGPIPNVPREFAKLIAAIVLFLAVGWCLAYSIHW